MNELRERDEFIEVGSSEPTLVVTAVGLPGQRIRILNLANDQERVQKLSELRARVGAGELALRRPGAPRVTPAMQQNPTLDKATKTALAELSRIRRYSERNAVTTNGAYEAVLKLSCASAGNGATTTFPSRATVYRRLEALRAGRPVLCGDANKGNRSARYSDKVTNLIVGALKTLHQIPASRWTIASITEHCNTKAHEEELLTADRNISRKYVLKVLFTHLSSDDELLRILPHLRAAKKAVAKNAIRVHGFLQRVEQDALHLPFRVQTLVGELRDIWLVHAIDVATSLVVGWALSVGPPTTAVSLACVESILYSKKARLSAMDVHFDADPYGAPTCLVFDNGSEAKNERISSLTSLGIEVSYCKSHHPHHKPFIERLNRALKEALETLSGCTRMDGKDGRRDPTALGDRLMSMEELERWIARFYYEDWANRPLDRLIRADFAEASDLGATPLARFLRMERDGYAMPMPPNLDDWRRVKFTSEKRTLARTTGITVETFHFRGQNLDRLINRFGETEVEVFVDPDDFRTVYVVNGEELVPLVNADVDEGTPVLSFSAAKAKEKAAKEVAKAAGAAIRERFRKDIFAASLEAPLRAAKRNSTSASKSVRNETKHLQAVEQARQRPLAAAVADEASVTSELSLEQFDALPIIDRRTGEAL